MQSSFMSHYSPSEPIKDMLTPKDPYYMSQETFMDTMSHYGEPYNMTHQTVKAKWSWLGEDD